MHWCARYIGLPHEAGARGPDKVDCWGLLRLIYAQEFQIELPLLPGISVQSTMDINRQFTKEAIADWEPTTELFDGVAVALSQRSAIHHVGIYTPAAGGKVIHCWDTHATIADTFKGLRLKGFTTIKFYRHKLWPTSLKP